MKSYTITVNGNVYDVTVEETGSTPSAPVKAAAPAKAPAAAPAPAATGSEGSVKVTAPMPGKVLSINANPGQSVKKGDTILVFEAMKMENEIVATKSGSVAQIVTAKGAVVETGAPLVVIA